MTKYAVLLLAMTLLFGCSGPTPKDAWPTPKSFSMEEAPRHIYLIVLDTLRADHLGCYGYARNTSPTIDTLAKQGMVFDRAYAPSSFTRESVSALLTGFYPTQTPWGAGWYAAPDPEVGGLPHLLQAQGYTTGLFTTSPVVGRTEFYPGFDETEGYVSRFDLSLQADKVTSRAIRFMQQHKEEKTFLYLHYLDPHAPYSPPDEQYLRFAEERYAAPVSMTEEVRKNIKQMLAEGFGPGEARFEDMMLRYDAEIAFVDESLKRLLDTLHTLGTLENSIIIFTADHGEAFMEHDFVGHAWNLYPETIHIPLIVWAPHRLESGRNEKVVSLVDLLPTLMQFAGNELAPQRSGQPLFLPGENYWAPAIEVRPVLSELLIQSRTVSRAIIHEDFQYIAAQLWMTPLECSASLKTIQNTRNALLEGTRPAVDIWGPVTYEALFNLQQDPLAQEDLVDQAPERVQQFRLDYQQYQRKSVEQQALPIKARRVEEGIAEEQAEAIAAVGYL